MMKTYIALAALVTGALVGTVAALPIKLAADGVHNRTVVVTVEQAAKRYSIVPRAGQDSFLYPELHTPRIPMAELDEAYR